MLLLGSSIARIEQAFVIINETVYEADSVIKAVDICYKSFFVFNANYPVQSYDPWIFLQRAVFQMETPYDQVVPRVTNLISKLSK